MSVNECWQGQRYKTQKYKYYEQELLLLLPKIQIPEGEKKIEVVIGVSSPLFDADNSLKPLFDILQKKYDFNDRDFMDIRLSKEVVKKGEEFISFKKENDQNLYYNGGKIEFGS